MRSAPKVLAYGVSTFLEIVIVVMSLPAIAFSAGSLLSTVEDMAKWDAALYTEKLLKKSSLDQMWTAAVTVNGADPPFNYSFGWFVDDHNHRLLQHTGGTPGFSSAIYRFIDDKLTVIILTNHADRIIDQLAVDLAGICLPILKRPEPNADPDPATTATLKGPCVRPAKGEIRGGILHASDAHLPGHGNRQGILEMVRRARCAELVYFL